MFFDDTHIWPRDDRPAPPPPRSQRERVLTRMALGYALVLLVLPVSFDGIVDLLRWIVG